ncbi:hypothetical protein TRFO_32151 [Tritrichomonas foetus]|uniref:Raptor N-terminal CASPase-like domain-containing protein n=1 Tax=Tritrichomonas foetus TaxID=1144522 RepID=A0A1J4JPN0_9EUKA|nr:hypothetical protein TRFO_32151 [Tritrichomonas foetus]|eukprot:OHT00987.1 hypothetical protein TRFO_32151 [Tritrichomonas foetus]
MHLSISNSPSSSDDGNDSPLKRSTFTSFGRSNIPRTTEWPSNYVDMSEYDEIEEDFHEAFPLSNYVPNIYSDFLNRKISNPDPFFILPSLNDEIVQIPTVINPDLEKIIIHLLDLPSLSTNKKHFIHTWCDLEKVTSVEAKRVIPLFFSQEYKKICDPKDWETKPEISWAKTLNIRTFSRSTQSTNHTVRIFHYVGLGFPPPDRDRIFMRDVFSRGNYTLVTELAALVQPPCMMIFDCDKAAILKHSLNQIQQNQSFYDAHSAQTMFALFSCSENEQLRIASTLPQNFFTCVLLSPDKAFSEITKIKVTDQKMFLQFLDIFADSIALDLLNPDQFHHLFRSNMTISILWRRFLLAQRLMNTFGLHCQSLPVIVDTSEHQLWTQFEYAMMCLGNGNTLKMFADLYQHHFTEVKQPPLYVCAFVTSLLKIPELKPPILKILAKFMNRSPLNCRLIGKVLDYRLIGDFESALRSPLLKDWCVVMSGLLLVENSLSKVIASSFQQFQDVIRASNDSKLSEKTRIRLLSILVCLRDSQNHLNCAYNSEQTTDKFLPILFSSSPQIRQWIVLFIHSAMSRFAAEPLLIGPTAIHAHAMLLMYDKIILTRAVAITILTTIMAPHWTDFNENVMRCAMKGAIDGSSTVRIAFLCCAARYCNLNEDKCDDNENEKIDILMRLDPIAFSNTSGRPKIRSFLEMLSKDPNAEVRKIAERILRDPVNSGLEVMYQENATTLHETAHANLFAKDFRKVEMKTRYINTLFRSNDLELFEFIQYSQDKVTCVTFDYSHRSVCYGTEKGDIFYSNNHWNITGPILQICHLPNDVIAVSAGDGAIHIFRIGFESEIDAFLPSIYHFSNTILMDNDNNLLFVAQEQNEINVWDISSLLLIGRIETDCQIQRITCIDNFVYAALADGRIIKIDGETLQVQKESSKFLNHRFLNIGKHKNHLWTLSENGEVFLWENFDEPRCILQNFSNCKNFIISQSLPLIISITDKIRLTNFSSESSSELKCEKGDENSCCCCLDIEKPLAAIGYNDGAVAVWRLPV